MESYFLDWANLLLRWLHVITAIAWIGSSFYFVFLDSNLIKPKDPDLLDKGVDGALWAVHGGGFYNPQKYMVAPKKMDSHLHWFFWESYSTWLSGFALFTVSYLWNAGAYLVDKNLVQWSSGAAVSVAIAFLLVFWIIYDSLCRLLGARKNGDALVAVLLLVVITAAAWLACHVFPGRAAFLLMGAMLATSMSANVFFVIIPGQRKVMAQMAAGQAVDPVYGIRAKQRSVHNTYFTLPVVFAMLSNHYSFLYAGPHSWLVLVVMMLAGASIRQFFVMRHGYKLGRNANPTGYALVGVLLIAGLIAAMRPAAEPANATAPLPAKVSFAQIEPIIQQRCTLCHGAQTQMKNIRLDSPELIKLHAPQVYQMAVVGKIMPLNNATQMTDEERALIGRWFNEGAVVP